MDEMICLFTGVVSLSLILSYPKRRYNEELQKTRTPRETPKEYVIDVFIQEASDSAGDWLTAWNPSSVTLTAPAWTSFRRKNQLSGMVEKIKWGSNNHLLLFASRRSDHPHPQCPHIAG